MRKTTTTNVECEKCHATHGMTGIAVPSTRTIVIIVVSETSVRAIPSLNTDVIVATAAMTAMITWSEERPEKATTTMTEALTIDAILQKVPLPALEQQSYSDITAESKAVKKAAVVAGLAKMPVLQH